MLGNLAAQLGHLDAMPGPAAFRFDRGPEFSGRVAVLPAAYNPPTLAHVHLLQMAAAEPDIAEAAALLSTRNVDKELHGATLAQRVEMLLRLNETYGFAVVVTNQARLADQSQALAAAFPGVEFDFVAGYDTLLRVFDERYYEDMARELEPFFANHRLIATNRGEHSVADVGRFLEEHPVARRFRERILVREIDDRPASLSSTAARRHAATSEHPLPQLPASVASYIRAHKLYQDD